VELDHNIWLLLIFNITMILVLSGVTYKLLNHSTRNLKVSECKATKAQDPNAEGSYVNRYLIIRRLIKIDADDESSHHLLGLQQV